MNNGTSMGDITQHILKEADILYEFVLKYGSIMYVSKDYGTGDRLNMIEAHLLTNIEENPGITGTELAKMWNRTKGAISQQIKKLIARGFVYGEKQPNNAKNIGLYVTSKGMEISLNHKLHDYADITQTVKDLSKTCTMEEITTFYKVMREYSKLLDE